MSDNRNDGTGHPQPPNLDAMPRFAGIPTFMRLPLAADPTTLDIALAGVPWDGGTTNRAGARHGPREVRSQSSLMRRIHHVSRIAPFELCRVGDVGDAPVNPINLDTTLGNVEAFFSGFTSRGVTPLAVGGDHLITLPILRALAERGPLGMVHFDAHSDTADSYFGGERYTHGTPFRRAVEEGLLDPKRVVQIGIRGSLYSLSHGDFSRDSGMRVITIEQFYDLGVDAVIAEARRVVGDGPTYVSFDVDGLDPVYAPGTGTPEVGGFTTHEAQRMIRGLQGLDLIGADVVEVAPPFDPTGNTALVGATMMFELLCVLADAVSKRRA
jgi:guanidinopropionase